MSLTLPSSAELRIQTAYQAQDWPKLVLCCRQALRKSSRSLAAHRLLGFALNKLHETESAMKAFRLAAALWPNDAELLMNYSAVLLEHDQHSQALPLLEKACKLRPNKAICWIILGQCCYRLQLNEKGFDAALKAEPLAESLEERISVLIQKAIHRRELGQVREAVQDCEAGIALNPQDAANHTNRLLFMLADPKVDAAQISKAASEFAQIFEAPLRAQWPDYASQRCEPWRRLKVGFISPDLRIHSVMYFVEGLLAQLDRRQFDIFAFSLYSGADLVTQRVKCHADHFFDLSGQHPLEQTKLIRAQNIDILIDLAGHTGGNGLLTMAYKAAPLQVSWLGYPATTGMDGMDYKFTDQVTDPPNADNQYSERLYRLPTLFVCYRPMSRNPLWRYQPRYLVRPTPALANGFITFGSCNNLGKLTDEVLTLWAKLLNTLPSARLLIEGKNLENPDFAKHYRKRCTDLGVDSGRLDLVPLDGRNQYLTYHQIDIALDPFPLTGGTTSFDLLWMGVPLVSMIGDSFKSRMGTGILTYLGRAEWLAESAEQYIEIAKRLADDSERLNAIRQDLRAEMEDSVLMREDLFCHHYGEGLRAIWLQWLAQGIHPDDQQRQSSLIESWLPDFPSLWSAAPEPGVGIAPGQRISRHEAHDKLQRAVDKAIAAKPQAANASGQIEHRRWSEVTELAETVLCAIPHDPVALACLAEVEHAHGHTNFAVTYLRYAQQAMGAP